MTWGAIVEPSGIISGIAIGVSPAPHGVCLQEVRQSDQKSHNVISEPRFPVYICTNEDDTSPTFREMLITASPCMSTG